MIPDEAEKQMRELELKNMTASMFTSRPDPKDVGEPPPVVDLVRNFYHGMKDWSASGFKNVTEEEVNMRLDICRRCEKFQDGRCLICGCFMKFKSKLATGTCPMNKWPKDAQKTA